ncbi:type II secretion system protein GspG [Myxococcaceae bacterium GXIMD 01537]
MKRFLPILVALLLALVLTLVVRAFRGRHDPAEARIHADFATVLSALERYRADGKPLPEEAELDFLVPAYLPAVPVDPWGRPYHYSSNGKDIFLASFGEQGLRGGYGPDEDHTNHDGHAPSR